MPGFACKKSLLLIFFGSAPHRPSLVDEYATCIYEV
jgi:hypothetical protein